MPDELLDVVNDTDTVITQEMRSVVHQLGLLHRGIHAFLVTPEGRLLVQQRGSRKETFPLALDCSVSEHVKAGENYQQAAHRGLAEELGIQGVRINPLVKFKMVYGPNDFEICLLYEGRGNPALVRFDPQEVERIASYRLEELETFIERGDIEFSSWFVQLLFWYLGRPSIMQVLSIYQPKRLLLPGAKSG
jgi:16S rRNA (adenine1518-N6/adenine1519-N6)-dimethyltransferase